MEKMRILLISNMYPSKQAPYYGTFVKSFVEGLENQGEVNIDKVVVKKNSKKIKSLAAYLFFFSKILFKINFKKKNYDIIYIHYVKQSLLPFLLVNRKKLPPLVLNAHGSDVFPEGGFTRKVPKIVSGIYRLCSKFVVPSHYFKEAVCLRYNLDPDKVFVSPSGGVDLNKFVMQNSEKKSFVIGYLGRIDKGKRWDIVLKAAKLLKDKGEDIQLSIGGGGGELNEMKTMIESLSLTKEVNYLGYIPRDEVPYFFQNIDVFLFPSERKGESLGLVAIEALASGIPVIAYNNGAVKEFIQEGYNGYVYGKNTPEVVVEKILFFHKLTMQEQNKMKVNARHSMKPYGHAEISKKIYLMLKSLTKRRSSGG